ncbi:tigger transposable element-derived protein 6-like [Sitodiplosis mosellana]|uniref:tigger transposable element-derived protein 6-like n=1 Tax=Sitodiplosis mosellana TaxID=263140 RepID=UPI0024443DBE|nr:tigger transposable element-derived protein 6-like [Sitodiplosis mosellana]
MKMRSSKFETINELTYNWFTQALAKNLPVSGAVIQVKAKEIAIEIGEHDFKASNGWLEAFKSRHKLTFSSVCGESKDVQQQPVNDFLEKLPEMIAGYKIEDIANCDETALFFRAIPKKTLHKKGEKCYGGKHSKDRLSILLCCFADGKFEKPLVIGKSQNPRCFKGVKKHHLPVSWYANKKAWMTGSIMEEFLIQLNKKMMIQKRNFLLFLDNASSHPNLKLSNVQLIFLPPNTTSQTQPLDQGIINAIKVHYRKRVLKRLICQMDTARNVSDLVKGITFLDAIFWLKEAIESLNDKVVPNCFRKAGFQ